MRRVLLAFLLVQGGAMALGLWANFGVALGLPPESALQLDWFAPVGALFVAAWWSARRSKNWRDGALTALICIGFWLVAHIYLTTRFSPRFFADAWTQLGWAHEKWWLFTLFVGATGGSCGARFSSRGMGLMLCAAALMGMWGTQFVWWLDSTNNLEPTNWSDGGPFLGQSKNGEAETFFPQDDGTTTHLLRFDLKRVKLGIYDADSDDSRPFDNQNATWLGEPLRRVAAKIAPRDGKSPLCIVNGGFFGNAKVWISTHEAPISTSGQTYYDERILQTDWPRQVATLVWKREYGVEKLRIKRQIAFGALNGFDGALGGVRVLRENGRDADLKPGMGGTTLKCSRTSLGFDAQNLWILSVRDPDGEASSVRANKWEKAHPHAPKIQVGGWDVAQVQSFWRGRKIADAVLFDGGESSQIGADYGDGLRVIHSSFHFSRTLGFLHRKPLRVVWPMLPPDMANGGVLNWFFVSRMESDSKSSSGRSRLSD